MTPRPLLDTPLPIVAAPMAGGPTTPTLVSAVTDAGGFGFLAGGYKTAAQLADDIAAVRERTDRFGVNLFVPGPAEIDLAAFQAYAGELTAEAEAYDLVLDPEPVIDDDDDWEQKLELLTDQPVPVVSFTFGLPDPGDITALKQLGTRVLATVTTVEEARLAREVGVDGLIVQTAAAGGHSAAFDPRRMPHPVPGDALIGQVCGAADLPVIAAGGVGGPAAVRAFLDAGAVAVAVGTLLLRTPEAGTSATHRAALGSLSFDETVVTRAFTGRPARALRNGFIDRHGSRAPFAYPAVHHLTRPLRQAAARSGDADRLHLWAGEGYRYAAAEPAGDVISRLAAHISG